MRAEAKHAHLLDTNIQAISNPSFPMAAGTMRRVQLMLLLQLCPGILTLAVRSLDEGVLRIAVPERREVYNNGKIYDITHLITPEMSKWGTADGMGQVVTVIDSIKNGSDAYVSEMKLPSHTGTNVDAPSHFFEE
ncbi:cyclase-like protein 2 [Hevea brasiliensis]|uniref:cyclase-like protein 2 n=1 Tax=Hevea brasiliensis TaxID=3981 RepID=UPI0025E00CDD|nr:cyclase-like protein 2 [Hevea brasiliensis]